MQTTGRWKLGLALALITSVCWGVLPIALKVALQGLDAYTITWYRFAVSAAVLTIVLAVSGNLPRLAGLAGRGWALLAVALLGLIANYVFYLVALDHVTPTIAQTLIQLAPMFFLLGGLVVFKERFTGRQWFGFGLLICGLLLFFNHRLPELGRLSAGIGLGTALLMLGALTWAAYALAQKALLKNLRPQQILLLIYLGAVVLLFPASAPASLARANSLELWMLAFSCANTLIAYGAFAEALRHWEASRIGAVLSTAPLITLSTMGLVQHFYPGLVEPEGLNMLSVFGALLVVGGSALCALAAAPAGR